MVPWLRSGRAIGLVLLVLVAACDGPSEPTEMSPAVRAYLDEMMDIMEAHALNRRTIDWEAARSAVLAAAVGAQEIPESYRAIEVALVRLGDGGASRLRTPEGLVIFATIGRPCTALAITTPQVPSDIGYVQVPAFLTDATTPAEYARAVQNAIRARDHEGVVGWVVDLRNNSGGSLWPMLAGIGPVLGAGVAGYFVDIDDVREPWTYVDGVASLDGVERARVDDPYTLHQEEPRAAVLVDNVVTGSGEAVAIAFRGRADTRFFGTESCGVTTATRAFVLSDGAVLNLGYAIMADRTGTLYHAPVVPDEVVLGTTEPLNEAIAWLRAQADAEGD